MKRYLIRFMAILILGPIYMAVLGPIKLSGDWQTAPRNSTGISPSAKSTQEAIVQVFSARTFSWRGIFGVHTWIATKPPAAKQYTVHQVLGWRTWRNLPVVVSEPDAPDRSWYGSTPKILLDIRGDQAAELIPKIESAINSYPYPYQYTLWPGPNSNTFIAWVARQVPDLGLALPTTAIGKDYLGNRIVDRAPSGTGYQLSLLGLLGVTAARTEGLEFNVLGLNFGVDPFGPAIKLPGVGQIGFD